MENDAWNPLQRRRRAVSAVVSDSDLMSLILRDTIGPSAFATASMVCKVWLSVCRSDEAVLRGVALYQGGLTKSLFTKLFAVAPREADALPHTTCKRFGGGSYFLYRRDAVDAVLAAGGINEWRVRLRLHAENPCTVPLPAKPSCLRLAVQKEERLHRQASQCGGCGQIGAEL